MASFSALHLLQDLGRAVFGLKTAQQLQFLSLVRPPYLQWTYEAWNLLAVASFLLFFGGFFFFPVCFYNPKTVITDLEKIVLFT